MAMRATLRHSQFAKAHSPHCDCAGLLVWCERWVTGHAGRLPHKLTACQSNFSLRNYVTVQISFVGLQIGMVFGGFGLVWIGGWPMDISIIILGERVLVREFAGADGRVIYRAESPALRGVVQGADLAIVIEWAEIEIAGYQDAA